MVINGIGEEYETISVSGAKWDTSIINSADYVITTNDYDGTINIEIDVVATMIEYGGVGYIGIDYELIDERGVCVETGYIWIDSRYTNQQYNHSISFWMLSPGEYTLNFYDFHL